MQIIPLEAPKPVGKLCVKGQKSPNMQGFFSPKEGVIEPNIAIAFSAAKADIARFATLFAFSDSISSNIPSCGISLSGQRGKLSWYDDQGLHLLTFSRPRGEPMQVKYRLS